MHAPPLRPLPVLVIALIFISFADLGAQSRTSSLQIRVISQADGRPLAGAHLIVQGAAVGALTGADGRVRLDGMLPGSRVVEARFLGYSPERAQVTLQPGRLTTLELRLAVNPIVLAPVKVEVRRSRLSHTGFFERRNLGLGTYFTREEIEATNSRALSDVMRRVPGAAVFTGRAALGSARFRGGQGNCPVQFYVDGVQTYDFMIDEMSVRDVEGLEIYRGAATLPPQFNKGSASCGVIVIWTRDVGGRGRS